MKLCHKLFWVSLVTFSLNVFAERPMRGTYEVPIEGDLKAYASYPLKYSCDNYQSPHQMIIDLPETLVGEIKTFELNKVSDSSNEWAGENVTGTCNTIDREFKCNLKFENLNIDLQQVQKVVDLNYQSTAEKLGRLSVSAHFSGEPIGIIIYRLRGRERTGRQGRE